jgi:hypothetical protein
MSKTPVSLLICLLCLPALCWGAPASSPDAPATAVTTPTCGSLVDIVRASLSAEAASPCDAASAIATCQASHDAVRSLIDYIDSERRAGRPDCDLITTLNHRVRDLPPREAPTEQAPAPAGPQVAPENAPAQ